MERLYHFRPHPSDVRIAKILVSHVRTSQKTTYAGTRVARGDHDKSGICSTQLNQGGLIIVFKYLRKLCTLKC